MVVQLDGLLLGGLLLVRLFHVGALLEVPRLYEALEELRVLQLPVVCVALASGKPLYVIRLAEQHLSFVARGVVSQPQVQHPVVF